MVQHEIGNRKSDVDTVSQRVVMAVAEARDIDTLELPPLYDVIDPDALDNLFNSEKRTRGRVVFMYNDCEVIVHSDGEVDITAPGNPAPSSSSSNAVERTDNGESPDE